MCGIAGLFGETIDPVAIRCMVAQQHHRGPDSHNIYINPNSTCALGHNRLSIIDLSRSGNQPMQSASGRYWIAFNGEIYNYRELRQELSKYPYSSLTDTEVILAAWERWGEACLDRFIGMFAFLLWDEKHQTLYAIRDRFGVKPLFYSQQKGYIAFASEIRTLHSIGSGITPNAEAWATYLSSGLHDHSELTFWDGIDSLPPGHLMVCHGPHKSIRCWYDLADRIGVEFDTRPLNTVMEEYEAILADSVRLRFRSDVAVGIAVSGGLDSSALIGLIKELDEGAETVQAFTYVCGDPRYDELPWVSAMLDKTQHPLAIVELTPERVPDLAISVQEYESEPFGGIPTLAYSLIFECAQDMRCIVLLDGQGMDEQWAGYDYYERALLTGTAPVQGSSDSPCRPNCLAPSFRERARPFTPPRPFPDTLRNLQYRDIRYTKIPRALRFNDRISMRSSSELREPFMDHRLFEIAVSQPPKRKIAGGQRKFFLRQITGRLLPEGIVNAPKRPVQTPQREWLRGILRQWSMDCIDAALNGFGQDWLEKSSVWAEWEAFASGAVDNSFFVWQWISLGLASLVSRPAVKPMSQVIHPLASAMPN